MRLNLILVTISIVLSSFIIYLNDKNEKLSNKLDTLDKANNTLVKDIETIQDKLHTTIKSLEQNLQTKDTLNKKISKKKEYIVKKEENEELSSNLRNSINDVSKWLWTENNSTN